MRPEDNIFLNGLEYKYLVKKCYVYKCLHILFYVQKIYLKIRHALIFCFLCRSLSQLYLALYYLVCNCVQFRHFWTSNSTDF